MYNKLVRDKIPDIIRKNGEIPITRILTDDEFRIELEKKLKEEMQEVLTTEGNDRIEELADLLEVISYLSTLEDSSLEEVIEIGKQKKKKRGGFDKKIYLSGVVNEK